MRMRVKIQIDQTLSGENVWFFDIFRRYKKGTVESNGVSSCLIFLGPGPRLKCEDRKVNTI